MADDKTKVGELDRSRIAKDQDYEIAYLAHQHGISAAKARELIEQFGNDRSKLKAAAQAESKKAMSGLHRISEEHRGDPGPKDRALITTMVALAGAVVLGLLVFAFTTDFPGPPPAGTAPDKSDAPPEDVRRNQP